MLEAADGREGLEVLATAGPVDVALVDWNMPEMNGLEFALRSGPARSTPRCGW